MYVGCTRISRNTVYIVRTGPSQYPTDGCSAANLTELPRTTINVCSHLPETACTGRRLRAGAVLLPLVIRLLWQWLPMAGL